jgi:predicted MPP superfamily phosphohydrolase
MKTFRLVVCAWWVALACWAAPGPDFTIVALPDTQFYSELFPKIFESQVDWIVANRTNQNIVYVAHLGDITQNGDQQPQEWLVATNALYRLLKAGVPLGVMPGNHDHVGGTKLYDKYFGPEVFADQPYYGGHLGKNNRNHYDLLTASGLDFVIVFLDFNYDKLNYKPMDAWAKAVLKKFPKRHAIVVSHCILKVDGSLEPRGQAIYDNLKDQPNLSLMLCGHNHGESRRSLTNGMRVVTALLSDYQALTNGGSGFLRLYQFSPSNNLVRVKTYSPWLDQYRTNGSSQFELPYDMSLPDRP